MQKDFLDDIWNVIEWIIMLPVMLIEWILDLFN